MLSSAPLSSNSRRLFPLLDPTVGRAVGAYFQFQKNQGQREALQLTGTLDDGDPATPDRVELYLQRGPDGTVEVDGVYGGHSVQADITAKAQQQLREKNNLIFGQAGESTEKTTAEIVGKVGDYPLSANVHTYRQEIDIAMTNELAQSGKAIYVLPFALSVTPTFGGAPARVNGLPGDVPTASTPLETTDRTTVQGQLGELNVSTEQSWVTTTWTISTNLRAGGSRVTMMQAEHASETEVYAVGGQKSRDSRAYQVEPGKGAAGTDRTYGLDFAAGIVSGDLKAGESHLTFELTPAQD